MRHTAEVKAGLECVVNEMPDATIYTVDEVHGRNVTLKYQVRSGEWVSGGMMDISTIMHPSREQRNYSGK